MDLNGSLTSAAKKEPLLLQAKKKPSRLSELQGSVSASFWIPPPVLVGVPCDLDKTVQYNDSVSIKVMQIEREGCITMKLQFHGFLNDTAFVVDGHLIPLLNVKGRIELSSTDQFGYSSVKLLDCSGKPAALIKVGIDNSGREVGECVTSVSLKFRCSPNSDKLDKLELCIWKRVTIDLPFRFKDVF